MVQRIFAFGTLKRGHPLHAAGLSEATYLGRYRTIERYPLLIAGPWFAPMMLNEPGTGMQILGELYLIKDAALPTLDRLESVGMPGNFRERVALQPLEDGRPCTAFAYMKARKLAWPIHSNYLALYDDRRFIPFDQRPSLEKP
jgi:gamma-glutamylaminecyclotransferase